MAESAVNFLIEYLGPLLVDEVKLLKGVRGEVRKIRDELQIMRAFLRDADAREYHNESIKAWVRQVRHAACDMEDILDEFIHRIGQNYQQDRQGIFGFVHKMARSIKQLKARHQIGRQIQDIKIRFSEVSKRKDDFNLVQNTELGLGSNNLDIVYDAKLGALFTEESQLVGIDGPKAWIIDWLLNKDQQGLLTISVVGMGGLGKTTLVKKVYDSKQVKEHFEIYAWITVSQTFKKMELLQDMVRQFYHAKKEQVPSGLGSMTDIQLIQVLRDYLQNKRFMLVIDDVWEVNAWNVISLTLPVYENGSRVVLTMRRHDVASSCCVGPFDNIYQLQPLDSDNAWSLFCRRAFPTSDHKKNHTLSQELEKLAQSFVNMCKGLPLAIVTLGSLLATKDQTYVLWEKMHCSLGSELDSDNNLKNMMEILWLSFNDLPYYLKSCFSYLSAFPEDYTFGREDIILLWIAEGFIEKKDGRTIEEVAESYFYALVSRSLIQVIESEIDGEVISFRIHDLLRKIIISKSGDENFIISSSDIEERILLPDTARRLSIYHDKGEMVPKCESYSSHIRSFFIFGQSGQSVTSSAITSFAGLHLLRVLSISNIYMDNIPKDVTRLLHLRYLSLYNLEVKHLPSSIGKLRNLETLIIEDTFICELPVEICELQRLCHLSVSSDLDENGTAFYDTDGVKVGNEIGSLRSLQELRKLKAESGVVRELAKLTQLRRLNIMMLKREDGHELCRSIEKMRHLQFLVVSSTKEDEEINLHSLSNPPLTLQELMLYGHLKELPHWISTLKNLRILRLGWSGLEDDSLKSLGLLPALVVLSISFNAYDGEELCVKQGEYPKLRELSLTILRRLKKIMLEKGAMPNLEVLSIDECKAMVEAPCWLGHLTKLQKLTLTDMSVPFLNSLQSDGAAQRVDFIQHITLISHHDSDSNTTQKF